MSHAQLEGFSEHSVEKGVEKGLRKQNWTKGPFLSSGARPLQLALVGRRFRQPTTPAGVGRHRLRLHIYVQLVRQPATHVEGG